MKITIKQDFTYWHGGCNPVAYAAGAEVEASDQEMIDVAIAQGWAVSGVPIEKAVKAPANKARKAAPENKQ